MENQLQRLEESIADKIKDYQKWNRNNLKYDDKHVDKWIRQFPEDEQIIVLTETDRLLARNYITEEAMKDFFDAIIWSNAEIMGENPELTIDRIQFLDIQGRGNSQNRLVNLIEEHYWNTKHIKINRKNHPNVTKYIYLDDCMFTGYRLRKDIGNWIDKMSPNSGAQLYAIFIGKYSDIDYEWKELTKKCEEKNISAKKIYKYEYNNDVKIPPCDILWPMEMEKGEDEYVDKFLNELEKQKEETGKGGLFFRRAASGKESELFTSSKNRIIFEKALLKKGAYICSLPQNRNERIKPMGFGGNNLLLGFGAFFATCYNMANNCPLAFWWGDPQRPRSETLGKWYPLLPRDTY